MAALEEVAPEVSVVTACRALGLSRATVYRRGRPAKPKVRSPRARPPRALSGDERRDVLEVLHSERFGDASPAECYHTLLDEGIYLASERTFYRVLAEAGEVHERRDQLRHPAYARPELLASRANEVWSWDIERHEALLDRAVMKGHRPQAVAAACEKLGAA